MHDHRSGSTVLARAISCSVFGVVSCCGRSASTKYICAQSQPVIPRFVDSLRGAASSGVGDMGSMRSVLHLCWLHTSTRRHAAHPAHPGQRQAGVVLHGAHALCGKYSWHGSAAAAASSSSTGVCFQLPASQQKGWALHPAESADIAQLLAVLTCANTRPLRGVRFVLCQICWLLQDVYLLAGVWTQLSPLSLLLWWQ